LSSPAHRNSGSHPVPIPSAEIHRSKSSHAHSNNVNAVGVDFWVGFDGFLQHLVHLCRIPRRAHGGLGLNNITRQFESFFHGVNGAILEKFFKVFAVETFSIEENDEGIFFFFD
jgi:hypothetical protein